MGIYGGLPPKKRLFLIAAVMLTVGSLIGIVAWANRIDYKTLYTGLSSEDSGAVINKLREKKVPYKVGSDGTTILIPSGSVYEMRMQLASEGLPQSSTIGYEIFDRQNLGVTEFIQKVNLQRALQGELSRTINKFAEVKSSRVHLTLPEKTLFREEQEKPRASIVLNLHQGKHLSESQAQGITHLVASSIEGMSPENVIIVDSRGKILAGGKEKFKQSELTTSQQQLQANTEKSIEDKIIELLGNVVGTDRITAKVSVAMDFTQMEQTVENYDPNSAAVRSEQRTSEKSSGKKPAAAGVPGVMSNTPDLKGEAEGAGVKSSEYNKSDETINYEISRVTKKIVNQTGAISRITAAVLIDGTYLNEKDKDGKDVRKYLPRTEEEVKKYGALVKRAVGYDEQRGDSVEVVNVQFQEAAFEREGTMDKIMNQLNWQSIITMLTTAFLIALFIVFALKPIIRMVSRTLETVRPAGEFPDKRRELGVAGGPEDDMPMDGLLDKAVEQLGQKQTTLIQFAQKNPRLFAQYLKNWLQ